MRLIGFSIVVACAWFVLANVVLSAVAWLVTPLVTRSVARLDARARAAALFAWRLLPSTASVVVSVGVAWPAFIVHESRRAGEPVTWWLVGAMALTAVNAVAGARALALAWNAARLRTAQWRASAHLVPGYALVVERGLETAAVAGVWHPTVFVGRMLSDVLTPGERRAVVAHEWAHARARDNVKRALLLAAPDLLRFTGRGADVIDEWMVATEHAADDHVASLGGDAAVDLAGALVKAARILATPAPEPALVRGVAGHGDLSWRVTRLLERPARRQGRIVLPVVLACSLAALVMLPVMIGPALSPAVHAVSEFLVNGRI